MSLADQIIEHGPVESHDEVPRWFEALTAKGINALRDELLEGRRLRAAAEARERYEVDPYYDGEPWISLECKRCDQSFDDLQTASLAELLRRADQHGEECT